VRHSRQILPQDRGNSHGAICIPSLQAPQSGGLSMWPIEKGAGEESFGHG
jgi:hypothetical protein